jgi:hypothetical protein
MTLNVNTKADAVLFCRIRFFSTPDCRIPVQSPVRSHP